MKEYRSKESIKRGNAYRAEYNKKNYKTYAFRRRTDKNDSERVINYLKSLESVNEYLNELVTRDLKEKQII